MTVEVQLYDAQERAEFEEFMGWLDRKRRADLERTFAKQREFDAKVEAGLDPKPTELL